MCIRDRADTMKQFREVLEAGKDVAFVIRKGALSYDEKVVYKKMCIRDRSI